MLHAISDIAKAVEFINTNSKEVITMKGYKSSLLSHLIGIKVEVSFG